jgi:hypothetical protein
MLFIMKKYLNQIMNKSLISKIKKWKIIIYKIILSQIKINIIKKQI